MYTDLFSTGESHMQCALDFSTHFEVEQMNGVKAFCFGLFVTDTIPQTLIGWDDTTLPDVLTPKLFRIGTRIEFCPEYEDAVREYLRNIIDPQL